MSSSIEIKSQLVGGERVYPESSTLVTVRKVNADGTSISQDCIATEEPLEICLQWLGAEDGELPASHNHRNIAVTMRTPGADRQLTLGFLFSEGIIRSFSEVADVIVDEERNRATVELNGPPASDVLDIERNFYITSSCGVCGKASIEAIRTHACYSAEDSDFSVAAAMLMNLPGQMEALQAIFQGTGSIHAAALFDPDGLTGDVFEDVGRHNAVDKLLGAALAHGRLPLAHSGVLVSGRASFELVQKVYMAGGSMLAAVGAPSSLAIDLAWDSGMTLVGFLRDGRFNIYTCPARIK